MSSRRVAALALTAACLLASCREPPPAGFAERALAEFAALKDGVTPAGWLENHAADNLVAFSSRLDRDRLENWCARAASEIVLPGGDTLRRDAYFYAPEPPPTLELPPASDSAQLLGRHCLLGAIWVETPVQDSLAGYRLGHEVEQSLSRVYRTVQAGPHPDLSLFGSATWRVPGRWEVALAKTKIMSAYDPERSGRAPQRVLAAAYLPRSRFDFDSSEDLADSDPAGRQEDSLLADAARLTGLDAAMTAALLSLRTSQVPDSIRIAAIRRWLAAADTLSHVHRATALFLADAVVPLSLDRTDSVGARRYGELGAEFVLSELDASYNSTHSLLEQARQFDPDGPIGQLVRLHLLRMGFNTNGMCAGGSEGFRKVIDEGEALLGDLTDRARQAEVHVLVGDAYGDIVALAAGEGSEYADSGTYSAEAPAARLKAVEHYRAALALDRTSARARAAWLEGWRLLAGLPPTTTHFFCVYD